MKYTGQSVPDANVSTGQPINPGRHKMKCTANIKGHTQPSWQIFLQVSQSTWITK
jgi:hypothetical protein